jgi:hypothetical protein
MSASFAYGFHYHGPVIAEPDPAACPTCASIAVKRCPDHTAAQAAKNCDHCRVAYHGGECRAHWGLAKALDHFAAESIADDASKADFAKLRAVLEADAAGAKRAKARIRSAGPLPREVEIEVVPF